MLRDSALGEGGSSVLTAECCPEPNGMGEQRDNTNPVCPAFWSQTSPLRKMKTIKKKKKKMKTI